MFTRQLERFATVLGLQCRIAVNFKQTMKQFHVQFVVFDNKNFLLVHLNP